MAAGKASGFMAPELRREREASKLDLPELITFVDGGEMITQARKRMGKLLCEDPVFNLDDKYFLNREEAFDRAMEKSIHYIKLSKELDLKLLEKSFLKFGMNEEFPIGLHEGMFLPTIEGQATEEQKEKWLQLANNYEIIGTYAQTELGHGTFVRGLETTATFDIKTQEFVLHTPTLTATKWWPGTLGHTATHAVILARLITRGVDYGIHPFIIQLRSMKDHTPLPGVTVGDIGPKFGYFGMDNGFLQLDHVRIPRDQMLMKYSQVRTDGSYVKPPTSKITYGTMVMVRSGIVMMVAKSLAKAITIATRYSVVRRQGLPDPQGPECQVLDYQTQQLKLLPLIASTYALIQTGQYMMRHYAQGRAEISQGNLEVMPELHATSSGLKAFSSTICTQGMEMCRTACGGHGYSRASGIPDIYVDMAPAVTYEGENTVLYLQTARYLSKMLSAMLPSSELPENISYLGTDFKLRPIAPVRTTSEFSDPRVQLELYEQRAQRMVGVAAEAYQSKLRRGVKQPDAWNETSCDWAAAANAHCHYISLKAFRESIEYSSLSSTNLEMMEMLCAMFAVFGITNYAGEFMTGGYMTSEQVSLARDQLYLLLEQVRPEAVPLVDAFDFTDNILNSALGRYDGDVYNHLYQWAQRAPRNKKKVHDVYHKHLKKLLHSKL